MNNEKFLNQTGLSYYHDRAKTLFENKIEKVKVNGTEQTITNKEVNVPTPRISCGDDLDNKTGLVSIQNSDANDGISFTRGADTVAVKFGEGRQDTVTIDLASKDYVDANGGKIDKIKVNGTEQTITNKEVDLDVPTVEFTQRSEQGETWTDSVKLKKDGSNNSYLEIKQNTENGNLLDVYMTDNTIDVPHTLVNKYYVDSTFRTETQVQAAIDDALADITGMEFVLVDTLPATGEKGKIYLVPNSGTGSNVKDEYIWLTPEGGTAHFEKIGSTDVDLSDYYNNTNLVAITTAEIDALFA